MSTTTMARLLALVALPLVSMAVEEGMFSAGNPIRKVTKMLEKMKEKCAEEGDKEEDLYKKYQCYCKTNEEKLQNTIKANEDKLPDIKAKLQAAKDAKVVLDQDIVNLKADRDEAEKALQEATALREKEHEEFKARTDELTTNIPAVLRAYDALKKSIEQPGSKIPGVNLLQTATVDTLRKIVTSRDDMLNADRQELLAFIEYAHGSNSNYNPQSGEIVGILRQMGDDMKAQLAEAKKKESEAVEAFKALRADKNKEIKALTSSIEQKTERSGELGIDIVNLTADVEDTENTLEEDRKFLGNLQASCVKKASEYEMRVKGRAEEQTALSETIQILNEGADNGTLDSLRKKKTAPAFVQVSAMAEIQRHRSRRHAGSAGLKTDLIAMALRGKKVGFDKVIRMIENMKKTLKDEQVSDEEKKDYCKEQFDTSGDKKQDLEMAISDKKTAMQSLQEKIDTVAGEIKVLTDGLKDLDQEVAKATEQRKSENEEYKQTMGENQAAKDLLGVAMKRMNKFYNPDFEGASFVQEEAEAQSETDAESQDEQAPPPPPETFSGERQKGNSGGVLNLLQRIIGDVEKQMAEAKVDEKNAQEDYQKLMQDSSDKRAEDTRVLTEKTALKGDQDAEMQTAVETQQATEKELAATEEYIRNLHTECDWLLKNFQVRKDARTGEIESLSRSKATLLGADYSLAQTGNSQKNLRGDVKEQIV
eukprot:TRINITY_DN5468_c0_g1_i1.p1 TRINITY_DN5468_c0_g1~~TRINITY_DN5468_c0_g1_i1.p1  ORF type:complete len:707 (+),score=234.65 TRINITY_DN5468_c0_g1_i1:169-2289(+)